MVTVAPARLVYVPVTGAAPVPQPAPAATHTDLGPLWVAAQLMAGWIVLNGKRKVPSAVASLPVGETGMQLLQSSSTTPSQSSSMPLHVGPSTCEAGAPGTHICTTPLTHEATVLAQTPSPQLNEPRL